MRNSKYFYNPETCQYEHATLKLRDIIGYCLGVIVTAIIMFAGLAFGYDRLTESQLEANLRKENRALDRHQIILANQLAQVESTLSQLQEQDQSLYQKLFEETSVKVNSSSSTNKNAILLADASLFETKLTELTKKTSLLNHQSASTNEQFGKTTSISKKDLELLNSIPTLQPIENPNLNLLVSGFGTRINPFHKGKYKHQGIDFAAPRSTAVFASAPGKVVDINKSDLQAGYGNSIDIDHGNGFVTRYAHLETIQVKLGQKISKRMVIGAVGSSGGSIAPHLHYEVIYNGDAVDPLKFMVEGLNSYEYNKLISLNKKQNQSLD